MTTHRPTELVVDRPTRCSRVVTTGCGSGWISSVVSSGTSTPPTAARRRSSCSLRSPRRTADQVEDQERALDAYLNIIDIDANHVPALESLAKLYERMDDPANAIEYMTRVAELTVDGAQRVDAFYRIGKQLEEKLGRSLSGARALRAGVRSRSDTHADLGGAARDRHRRGRLGHGRRALSRHGAAEHRDAARAREAARRARALALGDARWSRSWPSRLTSSRTKRIRTTRTPRCHSRSPLRLDNEQWEEAQPLTEMLGQQGAKKEREEQLDLYMLHGSGGAEAASRYHEALKCLHRGAQARPHQPGSHPWAGRRELRARRLGRSTHQLPEGAHQPSAKTTSTSAPTSTTDSVASSASKARRSRRSTTSRRGSRSMQHTARRSKRWSHIYEATDWPQSCAYRQQILDTVIDGDERFDAAQRARRHLGGQGRSDPHAGAVRAGAGPPSSSRTTISSSTRCWQLYQKTDQWDRMVDVLQRIAEADPKPERRARYSVHDGAGLSRQAQRSVSRGRAVRRGARSQPGLPRRIQAHRQGVHGLKDWGKLERAYRKMIHRVVGKGNTDLEYNLWHALGLIYRDRTQRSDQGGRCVHRGHGHQARGARGSPHLSPSSPSSRDATTTRSASYRLLLQRDPMNVEAYRAMYNVYLTQQTYDQAWCVAGVLAFLSRANEEEQRFFEDWKSDRTSPRSVDASTTKRGSSSHLPRGREPLHR